MRGRGRIYGDALACGKQKKSLPWLLSGDFIFLISRSELWTIRARHISLQRYHSVLVYCTITRQDFEKRKADIYPVKFRISEREKHQTIQSKSERVQTKVEPCLHRCSTNEPAVSIMMMMPLGHRRHAQPFSFASSPLDQRDQTRRLLHLYSNPIVPRQ